MWFEILAITLGYILGSLNPAYIFGKMKGVDIREVGMKNAGTRNVKAVLGMNYAIPTAFYDVFKGIISILIAQAMSLGIGFSIYCGFAAVLGHKYPFYLKFKGGQGSAAFVGVMLYSIFQYMLIDMTIFWLLFIIVPLAALFFYVSNVDTLIGLIMEPLLAFSFFIYYPGNPMNIPLSIMMAFMVGVYIVDIKTRHKFVIENEEYRNHKWRVMSRPFAVLFVVFYAFWDKLSILILVGIVALVFISMDLIRLNFDKMNDFFQAKLKKLYRKSEKGNFSSMTSYLVATFICILLFNKEIAILSILYVTFGDMAAKTFGMAFGRHPIRDKTREGTLAYLGACLIIVYIFAPLFTTYLWIILLGALIAPCIELLPVSINDNFIVPIISGSFMEILRFLSC